MDILCHGILFLGIGLAIRLEKCMESSWCKWGFYSDFSLEYIGMLDCRMNCFSLRRCKFWLDFSFEPLPSNFRKTCCCFWGDWA
jgi:hypothetical protein